MRVALIVLIVSAVSVAHMPTRTMWTLFETLPVETAGTVLTNTSGVPSWISGDLFHNGFGKFEGRDASQDNVTYRWNYLFDVISFVMKVSVRNGSVALTTRFTDTVEYNQSFTTIPPYRSFAGTTPGLTPSETIATLATLLSSNYVVNIARYAPDVLVTLSDQAGEAVIDANDLSYVGAYPFKDYVNNRLEVLTCAHPVKVGKYIYNYHTYVLGDVLSNWTDPHEYVIHRMDTTQTPLVREIITTVPVDRPSYMHSFIATENYLVFFEYPLYWNIWKIVFGTKILPAMDWVPESGTTIRVIKVDSATGKGATVNVFQTDAMFAYHFVNFYEDPDSPVIVADVAAFPNADHLQIFNLSTLRNHTAEIPPTSLRRYRIPVSNAHQSLFNVTTASSGVNLDLPRFNPNFQSRPYKYAYACAADEGDWYSYLVKVDVSTGETLGTWRRDEFWPSEPSFIPSPTAAAEDDGVVVSVVLDGLRGTSFLLILNGTTFEQIGFADFGFRVPFPSHGFFDAKNI
jgi:beta,beta-carotene 9',10'-dioxygenase